MHATTSVRVMVIRGSGGVFCSGADLKYIRGGGERDDLGYLSPATREVPAGYGEVFKQILEYLHSTISEIRRAPKPVIAAVDGIAAAGGLGLALCCDLVVASERSSFEYAYFKTGLSGAESTTFFLPKLVGLRRASDFVLLGPRLDARRAHELGSGERRVPRCDVRRRHRGTVPGPRRGSHRGLRGGQAADERGGRRGPPRLPPRPRDRRARAQRRQRRLRRGHRRASSRSACRAFRRSADARVLDRRLAHPARAGRGRAARRDRA